MTGSSRLLRTNLSSRQAATQAESRLLLSSGRPDVAEFAPARNELERSDRPAAGLDWSTPRR
jgi:hypothetical protein